MFQLVIGSAISSIRLSKPTHILATNGGSVWCKTSSLVQEGGGKDHIPLDWQVDVISPENVNPHSHT